MRKDVREFIRRLEAAGLSVESTPGHYHVLRDGKPLRKRNGMPFTLPFSPDTTRWRRSAIVALRNVGIELWAAARADGRRVACEAWSLQDAACADVRGGVRAGETRH